MKVNQDREKSPNDIAELVKRRTEKKATGVSVSMDRIVPARFTKDPLPLTNNQDDNLVDQFSVLMLGGVPANSIESARFQPPPQNTKNFPTEKNSAEKTNSSLNLDGTSNQISTLNKQESSNLDGAECQKTQFGFTLENIGEVKVNGSFNGSVLEVRLSLSSESLAIVPKSKVQSLERILRVQLASALGVPVEVYLD